MAIFWQLYWLVNAWNIHCSMLKRTLIFLCVLPTVGSRPRMGRQKIIIDRHRPQWSLGFFLQLSYGVCRMGFHNCFKEIRRGNLIRLLTRPSKNRAAQTPLFLELSAVLNPQIRCRSYSSKAKRYPTAVSKSIRKRAAAQIEFVLENWANCIKSSNLVVLRIPNAAGR